MAAQLCRDAKIDWIEHFKWLNRTVCWWYLNKVILKDLIKKIKTEATDWETLFTKYNLIRELTSQIYKKTFTTKYWEHKQLNFLKMGERFE